MARSSSGEVIGLSSRVGWVRLPHGLLKQQHDQNVAKPGYRVRLGGLEIAGSNPAVLTEGAQNNRAEVQMEARLLWEQEDLGSTPRCPT